MIKPTGGDDTQHLQDAFDKLGAADPVLSLRGDFTASSPLYLRDKSRVLIDGYGASITTALLDAQGTRRTRISGLTVIGNLLYGRGSDGGGGDLRLEDVEIYGDVTLAQADTSCLDTTYIHGMLTLTTHHDGLWKESTLKGLSLRDCWLDGGVKVRGLVQNVKFDNCYWSGCPICVNVEDYPGAPAASNQAWNLSFYNCNAEGSGLFLRAADEAGLTNLTIDCLNWACDTDYIIQVDTLLRSAYIHHISRSNPSGTQTFTGDGEMTNIWYDGNRLA